MYKFYIQMDGDTFGPYSAKEMLDLELLPDTMVTEESLNGTWYPASRMDFNDMYLKETGTVINEDGTIHRSDDSLSHHSIQCASSSSNIINEAQLSKFNWGAFLFTWIWGICNGVYWPLAIIPINFIPYVGQIIALGLCVYLGISGNKLAWEGDKQWPSFEIFIATQRKWGKVGLWMIGICVAFVILIVIAAC